MSNHLDDKLCLAKMEMMMPCLALDGGCRVVKASEVRSNAIASDVGMPPKRAHYVRAENALCCRSVSCWS